MLELADHPFYNGVRTGRIRVPESNDRSVMQVE